MSKVQIEMAESCGRASQILGLPRSLGQIYGLVWASTRPLCLAEISEVLRMSRGSVSTGTRQLMAWNAIRQIWVQGDRRDFFEVEPELGQLFRALYRDVVKARVHTSKQRLDRFANTLNEDLAACTLTSGDVNILMARLKGFQKLQGKVRTLIQLGEKLL